MKKFIENIFCLLIRMYQVCISQFFPPCCRFEPTCSHYAMQAIRKYGPAKGVYLSAKRIIRCNPLCKGGYDPVP